MLLLCNTITFQELPETGVKSGWNLDAQINSYPAAFISANNELYFQWSDHGQIHKWIYNSNESIITGENSSGSSFDELQNA